MAQAEDTELRDLVIEALEKNGSLAKIRALLRANIFLAFEDDCDSIKQNLNLDNILKLPEGVLALSLVHEFLEFCNLKNTLFVYMSESRQGRDYSYKGRRMLAEELHLMNGGHDVKEPVLLTFVKNIVRVYQRKYYDQGDGAHDKRDAPYNKDDENCTYIVHEDSTTSTSSNSDNSSDEKNKLHFKLPLDHSDTDTSSDSAREKSSEYIPSQHILPQVNPEPKLSPCHQSKSSGLQKETNLTSQASINQQNTPFLQELKMANSSESTSYVDIKSFIQTNQQHLGVPSIRVADKTESANNTNYNSHTDDPLKADSVSSATLNSISSISPKNENLDEKQPRNKSGHLNDHTKSDTEATEYSLDFTSSPALKHKDFPDRQIKSPEQTEKPSLDKTSQLESPRQNSQSSQSSVSISDVADLIEYSDKNLLELSSSKENLSEHSTKCNNAFGNLNKPSEESGDFSDSPIPSLSNLSLDVHSD